MEKIYLENVVNTLKGLADRDYQERVWVRGQTSDDDKSLAYGISLSFDEAMVMLLEDWLVSDFLHDGEIILDRKVTQGLREMELALDNIKIFEGDTDKYRPQEKIVNDPAMEVVRQKASEVLRLIEASDGTESTVRIVEPGEE